MPCTSFRNNSMMKNKFNFKDYNEILTSLRRKNVETSSKQKRHPQIATVQAPSKKGKYAIQKAPKAALQSLEK